MSTFHIEASSGAFAETVLMPGDPLRAKYIAENHLGDVKQVNQLRNMLAFTGFYKGKQVSVMGSGMGIPSISLYAHELFSDFNVQNIIRVGSCGALQADIQLNDIVIAMGACTDSNVNRLRANGADFAAIADFGLLRAAVDACHQHGLKCHVGNVFSTDTFYSEFPDTNDALARLGVMAAEMEAAGLYGVAAQMGKKALAINTVSDNLVDDTHLTPEQRQTGFDQMINVALSIAITE